MKKSCVFAALALCVLLLCSCAGGSENGPIVEITPSPAPLETQAALPSPSFGEGVTPEAPGEYWVIFLNVGRADAALICANGEYWLVDTGTKDSADDLAQTLLNIGVTKLSGVFLTHTHNDHAGGAKKLAQVFSISMFYRADITTLTGKGKDELTEIAKDCGVPETKLSAGDTIALNGALIDVLAPVASNVDEDNDNSLVFRLTVNGHTVLFTGDMQFAEEATIEGVDVSAEVLKVANHGNPDATGDDFAAAVHPEIAVISTNTLEDTDSANLRVKEALSGASIYLTEQFTLGVKVDFSKEEIEVSDLGFIPEAEASALNSSFTGMLVNRGNMLAEEYTPDGLVNIADCDIPALQLKSDDILGYGEAVEALRAMMEAAKESDVTGFYLVSVYRTYAEQQALWDKKIAADASYGSDPLVAIITAYPGASEHQMGLAFDISAENARALSASFVQTPQGQWLYANSWRFGFIVRYPENAQEETGIVFEPWHFRYVGKPLAAYLYRRDITLERFYGEFLPDLNG